MRITISLPAEQADRLADLCRDERISRAEVVRRALARYLDHSRRERREDVFGMWRDRHPDGLKYERRARGEWS